MTESVFDPSLRDDDRLWLRSRLSHDAIMGTMWPALCKTWERIPADDRRALRWQFDVVDRPGRSASVYVKAGAPDTMRIIIELGRDLLPAGELAWSFAHELAHVFLRHVTIEDVIARPVARVLPGDLLAESIAALLASGWKEREFTADEKALEDAADAQARKWGFTEAKAGGPARSAVSE